MEIFASCGTGLEPLLGKELKGLGIGGVRPLTGGVAFDDNLAAVYRALLWSRIASRILLVIARVDAADSDELYSSVQALPWEAHIGAGATIAISARGMNDNLHDTRFTALRVKDAICDRLRDLRGFRPDVDAVQPDVRIQVNLHSNRATLSIDLSGSSLEDRGYRKAAFAPSVAIHETLAAAMLLMADWPSRISRGDILIDDMCASGTIAIEAAMMAADMAPAITRSYWGFTGWLGHNEELWLSMLDEADARVRTATGARVLAYDARPDELACGIDRAKSAAVLPWIDFLRERADLHAALQSSASEHALCVSALLCAVESGSVSAPALYARVASRLLGEPKVETALLLTDDPDLDAYLGLSRTAEVPCMHGSAECSMARYDLDAGSSRTASVKVRDRELAVHDQVAQQFADRFNKVYKQQGKWARKAGVLSYRVYDADLPDYNMAIDLYEGDGDDAGRRLVHVAEYAPPKTIDAAKAARRMADALNIIGAITGLPADCVFVKRRMRARGGSQYAKATTGEAPACAVPGKLVTKENGLFFEVDLSSYLDTGLFLDHRDTRALICKLARDKSFLNLFAYTCTASVYAAAGAAKFTTSVDLSNTYLQWGQRNMRLNGLMDKHQEFVRADCVAWVSQTRHSKLRWDFIFIDPPTFSNSSKMGSHAWDVQRDHAELLIGASRLLTRNGTILFSCNLRGFTPDVETLAKAGVQMVDISAKTIPADFARRRDIHHCYLLRRMQHMS